MRDVLNFHSPAGHRLDVSGRAGPGRAVPRTRCRGARCAGHREPVWLWAGRRIPLPGDPGPGNPVSSPGARGSGARARGVGSGARSRSTAGPRRARQPQTAVRFDYRTKHFCSPLEIFWPCLHFNSTAAEENVFLLLTFISKSKERVPGGSSAQNVLSGSCT